MKDKYDMIVLLQQSIDNYKREREKNHDYGTLSYTVLTARIEELQRVQKLIRKHMSDRI